MRAALILPLAALIFLAGYITASYAVLNRVSTAASRLILDISDILFRVHTLHTRADMVVVLGARCAGPLVCVSPASRPARTHRRAGSEFRMVEWRVFVDS
jgi:hypothetical protein